MGQALQISDVLGYKPTGAETQQANLRSLNEEKARTKNPKALETLDAEIANVTGTTPAGALGGQVSDILLGKPQERAPTPTTPSAPAQPKAPIRYTNNPNPEEPAPELTQGNVLRAVGAGPIGIATHPVMVEAGKTMASGLWETAKAAPQALWSLAKNGGNADEAAQIMRDAGEQTRKPRGEAAQKVVGAMASPYNPINWISAIGEHAADAGVEKGILSPEVGAALRVGSQLVAPTAIYSKMKGSGFFQKPKADTAPFGSAGSAAASNRAAAANASPEIQQIVAKSEKVNPTALTRQVEADSLPHPIRLTEGEATGNPARLSWEQNNRGKYPQLGERFAERPEQFHRNMEAIRDEVAPNVYGADHVQNGRTIMDAYREHDATLRGAITEKYKALEAANGGKFPVDGVAFVDAANKALGKALKTDYVPAPIAKQMERFKSGDPMNFEQFEALRTNLASDIRSSADGNVRHAASIVLNALESIPMAGETAALKPLADSARAAAKSRFDLLKKDPAYKAVVNGKVSPDDFIQRFVVGGKVDNVKTMIENLQPNSVAHETMAAGVLNHLQKNAGANFNQGVFNKGLQSLSPDGKLAAIVGPKAAAQLDTLGRVAGYTQFQPRGSFVNNSNTLVGALAEHGKGAVEGAVNVAAKGIPIGSIGRKFLEKRAEQKAVNRSLQTGAGISLKDVGK